MDSRGTGAAPLTCRVLGARELRATCVVGLADFGPTGKREDRHDRRLTLSASSPVPAANTTARPPTTALLTITEAGCELLAPDTTNGAMTVHTPEFGRRPAHCVGALVGGSEAATHEERVRQARDQVGDGECRQGRVETHDPCRCRQIQTGQQGQRFP